MLSGRSTRRTLLAAIVLVLGAVAPALGSDAPAVGRTATGALTRGAEDRLLVRWAEGTGDRTRQETLTAAGVADRAIVRLDPRTDAITLTTGAAGIEAAASRLSVHPTVVAAEPDQQVEIAMAMSDPPEGGSALPDDPLFGQQWGLRNTGQAIERPGRVTIGVPGMDARVVEAWKTTRGRRDLTVAIIDTAIDREHRDLASGIVAESQTLDPTNVVPEPAEHGTAVAGVIGARAGDGFGIAGVAPETGLITIAAFETIAGGTGATSVAAIVAAMYTAVNSGADVINASWTTSVGSPLLEAAVADIEIPIVAAAGNDGAMLQPGTTVFPAGYDLPNVLSVTAIGPTGDIPTFANLGRRVIDLAAPGVDVLTTAVGDEHAFVSGTSFAAPHVAGALALARDAAPYATAAELVDAVSWTSTAHEGLVGTTRSGGRLDAAALVRGVQRPVCRPDRLPASGYADVRAGNAHRSGIACLVVQGITTGRADGTFGPERPVTRAQLAAFLARTIDAIEVFPPAPSAGYPDVPPDHVHAASIDRLAQLGIVRAGADGRFRPDAPVTRGQAASLLVQTYEILTEDTAPPSRSWYLDVEDGTHAEGIDRARDLGLVSGVDRVHFAPEVTLRRDQMASVLARSLDALGREAVAAG